MTPRKKLQRRHPPATTRLPTDLVYQSIIKAIGDGFVVIDRRARITMVNPAFERMTGWTAPQAQGRHVADVLRAVDEQGRAIPNRARPFHDVLTKGRTVTTRLHDRPYFYRRKDGTPFQVAITVTPLKIGKAIIGTVNVFRDISTEATLDRQKSEFVSLASHELRTPLTIMRWSLDVLLKSSPTLTATQRQNLVNASDANQHMIDLVGTLLNVSRLELGTFRVDPRRQPLAPLLQIIVQRLEPLARQRDHDLRLVVAIDRPTVAVDPSVLTIIITNLVTNAIKYSPNNSPITLAVTLAASGLSLRVTDTGVGIPSAEQPHVFHRFFRGHTAQTKEPHGLGLGLYITRSAVEQSGGRISFRSRLRRGTTFVIRWPRRGMRRTALTATRPMVH